MAAASYDQLLRQVEVLKMENSNLRQELQDNSNHLTKLETEASNMKVGADTLYTLYGSNQENQPMDKENHWDCLNLGKIRNVMFLFYK